MSANPPSALLGFPNEVIDDVLGQLVALISMGSRDPALSRKSLALQALEGVALVSRQWRGVALRRIVAKLVVRTGSRAREVAKGIKEADMEGMVRELVLQGDGYALAAPTPSEIAKHDYITPEDATTLLKLTPTLQVLSFNHLPFASFCPEHPITLPSLTTLALDSAEFDRDWELITALLPLFPSLQSLTITSRRKPPRPRLPQIPTDLPALASLDLRGDVPIATLLSLISIPESPISTLKVKDLAETENLDLLLAQLGPTLTTLEIDQSAGGLRAAVERCPNLSMLGITQLRSIEDAEGVLRKIPDHVVTLRMDGIGIGHRHLVKALETTPKPPGLSRLELSRKLAHLYDGALRDLETYGLRVFLI